MKRFQKIDLKGIETIDHQDLKCFSGGHTFWSEQYSTCTSGCSDTQVDDYSDGATKPYQSFCVMGDSDCCDQL